MDLSNIYKYLNSLGLNVTPWTRDVSGFYHPFVFDIECIYVEKACAYIVRDYIYKWWWLSIVFSIIYIYLIFYGQEWMKTKKPFELRLQLTLWNFFLALFSVFGMIRCVPEMMYTLNKEGLQYTICDTAYTRGITGLW